MPFSAMNRWMRLGRLMWYLPRWGASAGVWLYQETLSPLKFYLTGGGCCRFHPSCSVYAREALLEYGLCRGGWLSVKRVLKCHPFHPGGCDPVPVKNR